jgi:NADH:ubiquinone oxidoreductase subunit 5 (subunit L)/multisubunit Na+/H+ antiporter MnhA subunit
MAIIMNRFGDVFFLLGMFLSLAYIGSLDIITSFSHLNDNLDIILLCLFIAAITKSAQIYLHL